MITPTRFHITGLIAGDEERGRIRLPRTYGRHLAALDAAVQAKREGVLITFKVVCVRTYADLQALPPVYRPKKKTDARQSGF